MTKYARKILELVENSHSHMTADQVFLLLRETFPTVVLATVYNNLNKLCEEGLIRRVSVEGMPDRFDRVERDVYKRQPSPRAARGPFFPALPWSKFHPFLLICSKPLQVNFVSPFSRR